MAKGSHKRISRADRKRNPNLISKPIRPDVLANDPAIPLDPLTASVETSETETPHISSNRMIPSPGPQGIPMKDPLLVKELQRIGIVTVITGIVFAVVFLVIKI